MAAAACGPRCRAAALWLCRLVGISAALCLWGVAAEVLYDGMHLPAAILMVDACVVSLMESLFACQFAAAECCGRSPACGAALRALSEIDTYKRGILYTLLAVPCFVHYRQLWLPLLPGLLLLLAAVLHASRHCLEERRAAITKIPTFVRFDEESGAGGGDTSVRGPPLSHQSSYASTDESGGNLGSRDSGIETNRKEESAAATAAAAATSTKSKPSGLPVPPAEVKKSTPKRDSSPDRHCLLNDDALAWRD